MTRFFDVMFSVVGLLILWPLLIVIAIVGYFDTGSPIFTQTRVGRGKKPFTLIKFRTMSRETESVPTHLVDGSSVTRFGKLLRKTKLDELPQLINVVRGDMSLVGPRPCLFDQRELIAERDKRSVFRVSPGITGLAQINQIDMSTPSRLAEMDQRMIDSLSVVKYFQYIVLTVLGKGAGDRVRR